MNKINSANPKFIEAFAQTCFEAGFNEKQASELLNNYLQLDMAHNSPEFQEGFNETLTKNAGTLQALKTLGTGLGNLIRSNPGTSAAVLGGGLLGGLAPAGLVPEDYRGSAALGGGLGAAGALGLQLLAGRGRGLGSALTALGHAMRHGGVGRTVAGLGGSMLLNKGMLKGLGAGALAGGVASGVGDLRNEGVTLPGRYPKMPGPMPASPQGGGATQAGSNFNPFGLPADIAREAEAYNSPASSAPGGMFDSQQAAIAQGRNDLNQLDSRIQQLQSQLPLASNPSAYSQRMQAQRQIDNLKAQRNQIVQGLTAQENAIAAEKRRLGDIGLQQQIAANKGVASSQEEFENLLKMIEAERAGGIGGRMAGIYNKLRGTSGRLQQLGPIYNDYYNAANQAAQLQALAR